MNSVNKTSSFSFNEYLRRYGLEPIDPKVQESFRKYLIYKVDCQQNKKLDPTLIEIKNELTNPSVSLKGLKCLAHLAGLTSSERQQQCVNLNQPNLPSSKIFACAFYQIEDSAVQWALASSLQNDYLEEALNAHPFNAPEQEIKKMEEDLAKIPNSSLLKQYLKGRGVLDSEGRLLKADTPLETKQNVECCLQLLAHMLKLDVEKMDTGDLKNLDEGVSVAIYARFLVALGKNSKWNKALSEIKNSEAPVSEKIEAITKRISKENQAQALKESLSLEVTAEDLSRALGPFNAVGLSFLEGWKIKIALKALYLEAIIISPSKKQTEAQVRSKVEGLCRALGVETPQKHTIYELYFSYFKAFKERCAEIENPLHVLLVKKAHLSRNEKMLGQMRPKLPGLDTASPTFEAQSEPSPTDSTRTSNESPSLEDDLKFQAFISSKGLESREGTREYKDLLAFARDLYNKPVQFLSKIEVGLWPSKTKDECFKWLSSAFFVECLDVDLESDDNDNLEAVLGSFSWHAEEEIQRLGLPCIYIDMIASSLASGNVKRLKLIADEIAYARYGEAYPHTEIATLKSKTISEKIESTKNYLKKMKDKAQASYLLAHMESMTVVIGEVSDELQSSIDLYLAGSHKENRFYTYLQENQLNPLLIEQEKRFPYLFYIQKQFVKELTLKAQRPPYRNKGGAALACELKVTGFLSLKRLDHLAKMIECSQEVDMGYCASAHFYSAARKLFVDNLSNNNNPTFDVVGAFTSIQNLSEQKALLDELEKGGHHDKAINTIITKGTWDSYLAGYEWLRDKIKSVPEDEFMSFFLKYFSGSSDAADLSKRLRSHKIMKAACKEAQEVIKDKKFLGSPIRGLLESQGIVDQNGDFAEHLDPEEIILRLDLCLIAQRDLIKMRGDSAQLLGKENFSEGQWNWLEILTNLNDAMKDALKNNRSLEFSAEEVGDTIRRAVEGTAKNTFFSSYLKEIQLDAIKGVSPRKCYELYLFWTNKLVEYFEKKLRPDLGSDLGIVAYRAHNALQQNAKIQNWDGANANAKTLLLIESMTQSKQVSDPSGWCYQVLGEQHGLNPNFLRKTSERATLEEEAENLETLVSLDRTKWAAEIHADMEILIKWLNQSCLKSLRPQVDSPSFSVLEKKLRLDFLVIALTNVLNEEFERLGMSPSYKDLIERVFYDGNGSLCDFLLQEAAYGNYQYVLAQFREQGKDVSLLDAVEKSLENEPLRNKIAKTMIQLNNFSEGASLLEAIDSERLMKLVKAELEVHLGG